MICCHITEEDCGRVELKYSLIKAPVFLWFFLLCCLSILWLSSSMLEKRRQLFSSHISVLYYPVEKRLSVSPSIKKSSLLNCGLTNLCYMWDEVERIYSAFGWSCPFINLGRGDSCCPVCLVLMVHRYSNNLIHVAWDFALSVRSQTYTGSFPPSVYLEQCSPLWYVRITWEVSKL